MMLSVHIKVHMYALEDRSLTLSTINRNYCYINITTSFFFNLHFYNFDVPLLWLSFTSRLTFIRYRQDDVKYGGVKEKNTD